MIVKSRENREQVEIFSIEEFVPSDHLLRKIDSAVDFAHIYDIVEGLYYADNGRPSIDPVVIFKMVLIQHLYGIPSLRRTVEEIKMNVDVYDKYYDCVICPENQVLDYVTTNREGYKEFKSKGYICKECPSRHMCTENAKFEKTVTKHIWSDCLETVEDIRHTPEYKALYERRKETIERVFADAKEKHAMRYTPYRGLTQVSNWVRLKFAAMNLKKYAIHRWNMTCPHDFHLFISPLFAAPKKSTLNPI